MWSASPHIGFRVDDRIAGLLDKVAAEDDRSGSVRHGDDQVVVGVSAPRMVDRHQSIAEVDHRVTHLVFGCAQRGDRLVDLVSVRAVIVAATSGAQYTAAPAKADDPKMGSKWLCVKTI